VYDNDADSSSSDDDDDDDDDDDVYMHLIATTTTSNLRLQEEEKNVLLYGFENDSPELEADQMESIRAIPVESFSPTKHCNLMDFLRYWRS
jgi:hypothetical protein